ncbi:hypothetical protein PRIPAC_82334 [Pristionchus pacificus]|uniref:Uncharacterized protein n=1 Tax=Pristionchus pacificus TaxID=54126 RepID=A0A2A6BHK2_PRIPA|nr:hypothetical protein PRIPAC_82334 [Pristionchus pacificus]|eukprot:PDM65372.1 hypothetical protein PRIPAC_52314 [Pristionchus pacificus]
MTIPLNISNLDPDIKKLVLRTEENSTEQIRQISPSWNRVVLQYLKESRNRLPLERVYLRSGHIDTDYQAYAAQDFRMRWNMIDVSRLLHMHAIVPDRSKARIGLGKWLKTHQNFAGATEVTCGPQKIDLGMNETLKCAAKGCITLVIIFLITFLTICIADLIFSAHVVIIVTLLLIVITPVAVIFSLINIKNSGNGLSNSLASTAYTIFPSRPSNALKGTYASNFLKKLVKLGATVIIYEAVNKKSEFYKDVPNYFHRSVEFWDKMQSDLEKDGIALRLSTIRDDGFNEIQCTSYVRARFACMRLVVNVMTM